MGEVLYCLPLFKNQVVLKVSYLCHRLGMGIPYLMVIGYYVKKYLSFLVLVFVEIIFFVTF